MWVASVKVRFKVQQKPFYTLPKCHLIPVSTTTTSSKIGDQLSTVTLISPGKKQASSTIFLSELLNLVYFLFFYYTIPVQFFYWLP